MLILPMTSEAALAALNMQRGRDHGIADYNTIRRAYGLPSALTFSDVSSDPRVRHALTQAYGDVRKKTC